MAYLYADVINVVSFIKHDDALLVQLSGYHVRHLYALFQSKHDSLVYIAGVDCGAAAFESRVSDWAY